MKLILITIAMLLLITSCTKVITEPPDVKTPGSAEDTTHLKNLDKDITIVNWNIEWFGYGAMFDGDLNVQEANAARILKYLDADLYGICEVVDTTRFGRMIRNNLGPDFRYKISFYPTVSNAQKLAFVYNRNIFRNVSIRPFMGLSSNAYYNFAQRFPFLFTAEVVVNGRRNKISYFLMHAKADSDRASYERRLNGSVELKDSLDRYYSGKNLMILGDFNDHLNGSITTGKTSPYINFVTDAKYNAITLPLNVAGHQSTIHYSNSVIDNQVISSAMTGWYVSASAKIRTDVTTVVNDYTSGNTSDHYPVSSTFRVQ